MLAMPNPSMKENDTPLKRFGGVIILRKIIINFQKIIIDKR